MTFQPVLPLPGLAGWNFLQETYDSQLDTYSKSPSIQRDIEYFKEKFAQPLAVEDFLSDPRLRRVSLTAFGLNGEEWKTGYIRNILEEVQDPESTFLQRLNNTQYTNFAESLEPANGFINLLSSEIDTIAARFAAESFELAVGSQNDSMVITKGAGRMAEVGARFALDAMPGKQLAIDSDLAVGAISHEEAKARRAKEQEEAAFLGSLDGASKFVKGDAIAGLLITALNLIAGIGFGLAAHDLGHRFEAHLQHPT